MIGRVGIEEQLFRSLKRIDLIDPVIRIGPGDHGRAVAVIVSQTFEGMNEARRQEIVWDRILKDLDEDEQREIEFLYTDTPSERAEIDAE